MKTTITSITVTLSTLLLAAEFPVSDTDAMDSADHARLGDRELTDVRDDVLEALCDHLAA